MNIRTIWASLEAKALKTSPPSLICKRVSAAIAPDLFVGITASKTRALLLELPNAASGPPAFAAKGLQLSPVTLKGKSGDTHYWQLALTHPSYLDLFVAVTEDIIAALSLVKEKRLASRSFLQRLSVWQEFLSKFGPNGLGDTSVQGLIGELWYLKERASPLLGHRDALNAWKGPQKRPRDFEYLDAAIEVKTTTGKQHVKIHISNENQLDDAGLRVLYLCHLQMVPVQKAGLILPDLVSELRENFTLEGLSAEFDRKLQLCGYLDSQSSLYDESRYRIAAESYYRIVKGFPRILTKDVPAGVGDLQYSVAVSALKPFEVTQKSAAAGLKSDD